MILQKELPNNPFGDFGNGDLHVLPYPGLQQADTCKATFYKCLRRSENVILTLTL